MRARFGRQTGLRRLAMAGGVALNCTANGRLMQSGPFDEIYVQPAAGDDGSALGAALYRASLQRRREQPCGCRCRSAARRTRAKRSKPCSRRSRTASQVDALRHPSTTSARARPRMIADGRVLAWHRGRMEFGPRALGNRSILADPGNPEMRDRINAMVKKREAFRPFAPAVTARTGAPLVRRRGPGTELPYMIMIVDVRTEHRASLPAITHVNGSARVQTVSCRDNPEFHALLKAVGAAHRARDGAEHQLQRQGAADRQQPARGDRDVSRHRHRRAVSRACARDAALRGLEMNNSSNCGRRCIPPGVVARRSHTLGMPRFSRLAGRAPQRPHLPLLFISMP